MIEKNFTRILGVATRLAKKHGIEVPQALKFVQGPRQERIEKRVTAVADFLDALDGVAAERIDQGIRDVGGARRPFSAERGE